MKAIALLAISIGILAQSRGTACLCFEDSVATAYAKAKAVFIGTVVGDEYVVFSDRSWAYHVYTLAVEHSWKGSETKRIPVIAGGLTSCDIKLRLGETLLIYGHSRGDGDTIGVGYCTRIRTLARAGDDIRALNYLTGGQWIVEAGLGAATIDNDDWKRGFAADAALRYTVLPRLSARARFAYSHHPFMYERKLAVPERSSGREMQVFSTSVEAIWRWSANDRGVISPYIAVGPGFTWYKADEGILEVAGASVPVEGFSGSAAGIFGALGLDTALNGWMSLFLEGQVTVHLRNGPVNRIGMGIVSGVQVLL